MAQDLRGVPGGAEVWERSDGRQYLVYYVPNTKIPMLWRITGSQGADFRAANPGYKIDKRRVTPDQMRKFGAIGFGDVIEINNTSEHPFAAFTSRFKKEAEIRPWLRDPEVLALTAGAIIEGRAVSEAELKTTRWWRSRNEAQRQWATLVASDPKQARTVLHDNTLRIRNALVDSGFRSGDEMRKPIERYIAERLTSGRWTEQQAMMQVRKLSDPYTSVHLDTGLKKLSRGAKHTRENEERVNELVRTWLGPNHDVKGSANQREWAARLRLWSDGEDRLIQHLRKQRMALFPEYEDDSLTYEDIAAPWRGVVMSTWGQTPDETDPLFTKLIRQNDMGNNTRLLRQEGMNRGVTKVMQDITRDTLQAIGGSVRRAV